MIGSTLGKFHIEAQVSSGGMGTIYRARHVETGQVVALKVLQQALAADRAFLQRFRREVAALKKVEHPNVVRICDVGSHGDVHYYAMEYLDQSLADVLRAGPVDLSRALKSAGEAARGLAAVHAAGIRHRDVKPSNVLFDAEGHAKVADFGIAKLSDATRVTQTGVIVGTPAYMAPEQVERANVDARSDIYSLGVVLYEMVVGRPPFGGNTTLDILRKHRYTLPESPKSFKPAVPAALAHLVMSMLAKIPSQRPDSMAMVADALEHIGQNIAADATAPASKEPRRELSSAELTERYERIAGTVIRWGKFVLALAALALLTYGGYCLFAYLTRTPASYLRAAREAENGDKAEAARDYEALVARFPASPEAVVARERIRAIDAELRLQGKGRPAAGESESATTRAIRAQIAFEHYRRAEKQREAGEVEHARRIYRMVRMCFSDTPWGTRADQRLDELNKAVPRAPEAPR